MVIACPHCTGATARLQELLFSNLAYIKDKRRNGLHEEHQNACLMLAAQCTWDVTFPYSIAMGKWADVKEQCLAVHCSKHQRQGWQEQSAPVQLESDSDKIEGH